jgi:quercetin dioxygenase-like cupin family protein
MQIIRNGLDTSTGPSEWFTGAVYIDTVATPSSPSRLNASSVHFTPEARTAWHTHPNGQTMYVTEGVGLVQGAAGRSRWFVPATACSSSPVRITGTVPG